MSNDLYHILGLDKNSSEADIKKAYRRKAREYHPDVNKEAGAEDRFKEIQKAYSVLSDPQKKMQYDQFGVTDDSPRQGGFGGAGGFEAGGFSDAFEDIFDVFFGGRGGQAQGQSRGPRQGDDLRYDLELSLEEIYAGTKKEITIFHLAHCSSCKGSCCEKGSSKETCQQCRGTGQVRIVQKTLLGSFSQVSVCPTCSGAGQSIKSPCRSCSGRGVEKQKKNITVSIPKGVEKGTRLRISGEGNQGEKGGGSGDLYVFVSIKEHKYFHREGNDLFLDIEIPFIKAVLGASVDVPIIDGSATISIPAGTQPDTIFKLSKRGIPNIRGFGSGDLYIKTKMSFPTKLTSKEKSLLTEFAAISGQDKKKKDAFAYVKSHHG